MTAFSNAIVDQFKGLFPAPMVVLRSGADGRHYARQSVAADTRSAFTLIELMVALAIVGVLAGLLLPAIQQARETVRRTACQSHLRNQVMAVLNFEQAHRLLPIGRNRRSDLDWGWSFYILPMLEQEALYLQADQRKPWDDPANQRIVEKSLAIYRCPSAAKDFPGDCDYAGLSGTILGTPLGHSPFNRGILVYVDEEDQAEIAMSSVTDGVSYTLAISENHDLPSPVGRWASGTNCISHDNGRINSTWEGIRSLHPAGANAAYLDGSVVYLSNSVQERVLMTILTRNGNEVNESWD